MTAESSLGLNSEIFKGPPLKFKVVQHYDLLTVSIKYL